MRAFKVKIGPALLGFWVLAAQGCSQAVDGADVDAGIEEAGAGDAEAGAPDARRDASLLDLGVDAADAEPMDRGPPVDSGACGCSYGFHQECGGGEICGEGFGIPVGSEPIFICERRAPAGGALAGGCTGTSSAGRYPCNGQCVPAERGTACGYTAAHRNHAAGSLYDWFVLAQAAMLDPAPELGPWRPIPKPIYETWLSDSGLSECNVFVAWTALGILKLCAGDDIALAPPDWSDLMGWRFPKLSRGDCRLEAASSCLIRLRSDITSGQPHMNELLADIHVRCPGDVRFGAPCNAANADVCLAEQVETVWRAFVTPVQ